MMRSGDDEGRHLAEETARTRAAARTAPSCEHPVRYAVPTMPSP